MRMSGSFVLNYSTSWQSVGDRMQRVGYETVKSWDSGLKIDCHTVSKIWNPSMWLNTQPPEVE